MASKLDDYLKRLEEKMEATEVRAGFLGGATYPNGTSVAMVATVQEFGGTINIPEHERTLYFHYNERQGKVGHRFVKPSKANFAQSVMIPAHTVTIPPRPFFRQAIAKNKKDWVDNIAKGLRAGLSSEKVLEATGAKIVGDVQESISTLMDPPLSDETIRNRRTRKERKNYSTKPLVDTKVMIGDVHYEVK